ncbi:hypothetical protein NVP1083O_42 [Vibrio phage 1.083.O._10N.286.52.B9]|nr:hypothetical protein NVP1083O_42 [Vibrio phage 1.083.O._10N.286.52.B9]
MTDINIDERIERDLKSEIDTHKMLLEMDVDELYHHLLNPVLFNKVAKARSEVLAHVNKNNEWGSCYE